MKTQILKIALIALVAVVGVSGKDLRCYSTDDFYKKFPQYDKRIKGDEPTEAERKAMDRSFAEYTGAFWAQNCLGGVHDGNSVPAGAATYGIHVGCGYGKSATKYLFKIRVHQKNPCFIISKNKAYKHKATIKKLDSHTVEITVKTPDWCDIHLENYGRVGTDHKYRKKVYGEMLLGDKMSCVDQDNVEKWDIFVKEGNDWKPFKTETFYIRKDHPVLK